MKDKKGFTLVELLAVIVILGILSTVGVISYGRYLDKARKQSYDAMFESIYDASQNYMMDYGIGFTEICISGQNRYGVQITPCTEEQQTKYQCDSYSYYGCSNCKACTTSDDVGFTKLTTASDLVEAGYLEKLIDPVDQGSTCDADIYAHSSGGSSEAIADYSYVIKLSCKKNNEERRYSVSEGMKVVSENTK